MLAALGAAMRPMHCTAGIPKVALLFLVVQDIPHHKMWTDWLAAAADVLPRHQVWPPRRRCAALLMPT
jgi:hypothetical protein